jgi:hypothetical protein
MNDSILLTIKKMLGLDASYTVYDEDVMVLINSCIRDIHQLGVGEETYSVTDSSQTWTEYLGAMSGMYDDVKSYIYYKVRLAFNPPSNSFVVKSYEDLLKENAFRILVAADIRNIRQTANASEEDEPDGE